MMQFGCLGRLTNSQHACAARVYCSHPFYLSVKSHLTNGASVRPENTVMYSAAAGNGGQKICEVFSETASSVARHYCYYYYYGFSVQKGYIM